MTKKVIKMTEQEVINNQLKTRIEIQYEKFNMFMNEMRDRDNQRHAEMAEIRTMIDGMGKHVRNLTYTAIGAIGAMALASGAMAASVIYSVFNSIPK